MIEHYTPKEHPLKSILLKDCNLSLGTVANYIGSSYQHCCNMLCGRYSAKRYEKKLNELIELCKQERGNA